MKKASYRHGFTLVELILVSAILAVIGVSLYGVFANGISIWRRVTQESVGEDISVFFDKIAYDLRNSFKFTGLRFRGTRSEMSFPSKIRVQGEDGVAPSIGRITYEFDRRKKTVNKWEADYSDVYREKDGTKKVLSEAFSSLRFEYFVYDDKRKSYSWVTSWQEDDDPFGVKAEEQLPLIVKVEVGVPGRFGEQKFVKNINVPSACCWPFVEETQ